MKKNVGQLDRLIRLVLGVALVSLFFLIEGDLKWVSLIGFVLIVTALINFCPLYLPFGINTRTLKK